MTRTSVNHVIYLQLPARHAIANVALTTPLHFALAVRGRLLRAAIAPVNELAPHIVQATDVVLLLAASDVTLLKMVVPPLSTTRVQAALPALLEDHILGDIADCAIAAGPDTDGQRLIAVCERAWLQSWVSALRELGARRIRIVPISLCVPIAEGTVSAALLSHDHRFELALRLSEHEALGLPIELSDERELPNAVGQLLLTLVPGRQVYLFAPPAKHEWFTNWVQAQTGINIHLQEQPWTDWIFASSSVPLDMMSAISGNQASHIDWRPWRWPIALTAALALFNIVSLNADWWRLHRENLKLRDDIMQIYSRSFPNDKVVLDPPAQMKQKIAAARTASGQLNPSDFIVLSAALGEAWQEAGNDMQAITSLDYRDGTLHIKLKQDVQVSLEAMRDLLAAYQLQIIPSPGDPMLWQLRSL